MSVKSIDDDKKLASQNW